MVSLRHKPSAATLGWDQGRKAVGRGWTWRRVARRWGQEGRIGRAKDPSATFFRVQPFPRGGFIPPFERPPGPAEKSFLMTIPATLKTRSDHYGREYRPLFPLPLRILYPRGCRVTPPSIRNSESLVGLKMWLLRLFVSFFHSSVNFVKIMRFSRERNLGIVWRKEKEELARMVLEINT